LPLERDNVFQPPKKPETVEEQPSSKP